MLFNILIFILVLSVLIFFHELGHYAAAKACGIYVDQFSLGMPPRVAGIRLGETDYCIGLLPIGGYVKMAGQEDVPLSEEERVSEFGHVPEDRWYSSKPVWQRAIVIAAGPCMNVVLAVLLYIVMFATPAQWPEAKVDNRIGAIKTEAPAATAPLYQIEPGEEAWSYKGEPDARGWQPGDRIIEINGREVSGINDIAMEAALGGGEILDVHLARAMPDGTVVHFMSPIEPKVVNDQEPAQFGVAPFMSALIDSVEPGMPAAEAGIQPGDIIERLDGKQVDRLTLAERVSKTPGGEAVQLDVRRDGSLESLSLKPETVGSFDLSYGEPPDVSDPQAYTGPPFIYGPSSEAGMETELRPKDRIVAVRKAGMDAPELPAGATVTVDELRELERENPGAQFVFTVERPAVLLGLIQRAERLEIPVNARPIQNLGIVMGERTVTYRMPIAKAVPESFVQVKRDLGRMWQTIHKLATGGLSVKALGGPVMIFQATAGAARQGPSWLLEITAFISINLFVVNLLPLPVLDGGHLVFLTIEAIRRKPISMRITQYVQQFGLLLILFLFVVVTWNDVSRIIMNLMP
ncbi:MAG: site-2 protease family protein [Candidatus Hydrogenedentes bacterium]|nr:site-2 protease family protein [Candidatus Hydrogenedentota bacterium]